MLFPSSVVRVTGERVMEGRFLMTVVMIMMTRSRVTLEETLVRRCWRDVALVELALRGLAVLGMAWLGLA